MRTMEAVATGRDNNFNLLRMVAASAVLVSHAWPIALGKNTLEPLSGWVKQSLGGVAVTFFFAASGFFITKSFLRRTSLTDFIMARLSRIYPALIVVLVLTAFVLGPVLSRLTIYNYLSRAEVWSYVPRNLSLFELQYSLPGVFLHNPIGSSINGSLWTLFSEVTCYGFVAVFASMGAFRPVLFPIAVAFIIVLAQVFPEDIAVIFRSSRVFLPFAMGAAAYIYRKVIPISIILLFMTLICAILMRNSRLYPVAYSALFSYAALWFGFADLPWIKQYNKLGDYSYGMYIYAFPVEQTLAHSIPGISIFGIVVLSFPVTLALAVISWTFIEAPSLAHRHRIAAYLKLSDIVRRDGGRRRHDRAAAAAARGGSDRDPGEHG